MIKIFCDQCGEEIPLTRNRYSSTGFHFCQICRPLVPKRRYFRYRDELSKREVEVLGLIVEGYSNREIAEKLVITIDTVKRHTSNIYQKLGVKNRAQAILASYHLGNL